MTTISVRIDDELKKKMEAHPDINWSGVIRAAINDRTDRNKDRDLVKAIIITEKLRRKPKPGWDSTKVIREWRQKR
jgi:Arc/MetJ-type ribon-helix-helix transcriptional regulator